MRDQNRLFIDKHYSTQEIACELNLSEEHITKQARKGKLIELDGHILQVDKLLNGQLSFSKKDGFQMDRIFNDWINQNDHNYIHKALKSIDITSLPSNNLTIYIVIEPKTKEKIYLLNLLELLSRYSGDYKADYLLFLIYQNLIDKSSKQKAETIFQKYYFNITNLFSQAGLEIYLNSHIPNYLSEYCLYCGAKLKLRGFSFCNVDESKNYYKISKNNNLLMEVNSLLDLSYGDPRKVMSEDNSILESSMNLVASKIAKKLIKLSSNQKVSPKIGLKKDDIFFTLPNLMKKVTSEDIFYNMIDYDNNPESICPKKAFPYIEEFFLSKIKNEAAVKLIQRNPIISRGIYSFLDSCHKLYSINDH